MKYIFRLLFVCASFVFVFYSSSCNKKSSDFYIKLDKETETISGGIFEIQYPELYDNAGNAVLSYKITVSSIVDENGNVIESKNGYVDFSKQGHYLITYGVDELPNVSKVTKTYKVIDDTPPIIKSFDYHEVVIVNEANKFPNLELYDAAGINEDKVKLEVIDKYNNVVKSDGKRFTVNKAGNYRFRIIAEDINGVSKTYYYPFKAVQIENPVEYKIAYLDEEYGNDQFVTGLKKGEYDERYTLSYTTKKAYGDEKGSTLITINEDPTNIYLRLEAPYIKDVSIFSRLTLMMYVDLPEDSNKALLAGAYSNYLGKELNKWVEVNISTNALGENGSIINGLTKERITSLDITGLTLYLFRWSNPQYGGREELEGFPKGTKIYLSSLIGKLKDPSIIYEFTPDLGDFGMMALNKETGEPVNSYGGNQEHGSFVGLGKDASSVRFYLQNETQTDDEYDIYLPLMDIKNYGTITFSIETNNCKKVGLSKEECIDFANPASLVVTMNYNENTDDVTITFESGNRKLSTTINDQDVINGYSQLILYAVGTSYTEIYINPIRKA